MKKLLIASAALAMVAGTAQAQSSVTAYGILDIGYASESKTAVTAASAAKGTTTEVKGINTGAGLSGNRIGFRGTEDLGGGLTAGFTYELGVTPENATQAHTTRQALISLSSKSLGSLNFGRGNSLGKNTNDGFTAFGGGGSFEQGSVALDITRGAEMFSSTATTETSVASLAIADRHSNQVTYISPSFNGVTLSAQVVARSSNSDASTAGGETSVSGTAFSLGYAGKDITATYTRSVLESDTEAAAATTTAPTTVTISNVAYPTSLTTAAVTAVEGKKSTLDQFGATYTMGGLKVFGLYNALKYKASSSSAQAENKGYDIGATYTMGKTTLLASMGDGEIKDTASAVTDVSGVQAQVRYALSKRTTAYAIYGKTEYEGARKGESDVTMFGVRHTF
jgi:predicted porin